MYHLLINMQHMYHIFNFAREISYLEEFVLPSVATDPNFGCFLQHTSSAPALNGGSLSVQLTVGIRRYCGPIRVGAESTLLDSLRSLGMVYLRDYGGEIACPTRRLISVRSSGYSTSNGSRGLLPR